MEWVLLLGVVALVIVYCARQQPRWPFLVAAVVGGVPGAICVLRVLDRFAVGTEPLRLHGVMIFGGAFGAAAGAGVAFAIVGSCMGPRPQQVGGLLGALLAAAVGPSLMLLAPQWCFERVEDFAFVALLSVTALLGAFVGAQLGRAYHRFRHAWQKPVLVGAVAAVAVAGVAHLALRTDTIRAHVHSIRQLREAGDVEAMLYKVASVRRSKLRSHARDVYVEMAPRAALEHEDWHVRYRAAIVLGAQGDERTLPILLEVLKRRRGFEEKAIRTLGALGDRRAVPVLLNEAQDPQGLRMEAMQTLGKIHDRRAVLALIRLLKTEDDADLARVAARTLGRIGDQQAVPVLMELLNDERGQVARAAARALGQIGDGRAVPALLEGVTRSAVLGSEAAQAAAKIRDPRVVPALVDLLAHKELLVRWAAVAALRSIDDPAAVQALIEALKHPEAHEAARDALENLGKLDTPEAQAAHRAWEKNRERLERPLVHLQRDGDIEGIVLHFRYGGDHVEAARALAGIARKRSVPILIEKLKDAHRHMRQAAAVGLGETEDEGALPPLIEALSDSILPVREAAVEALGRTGRHGAVDALANALRDRLLHSSAAEALTRIGTPAARAALEEYNENNSKPSWWADAPAQGSDAIPDHD